MRLMRRPSKKSLKDTTPLTFPSDDSASSTPAIKAPAEVRLPTAKSPQLGTSTSITVDGVRKGQLIKSDVFAKLSKRLDRHAAQLAQNDRLKEKVLREKVVESLKGFKNDRLNLGRQLLSYKSVFKSERHWTRVVAEIGKVVDLSARTVFRIIEEYEHGGATPRSAQKRGSSLPKQERVEIRARLAIRSFLDDTPTNRKAQVLASLLAEEAYQIWGSRKPLDIRITPTESRFHIDGRKRKSQNQAKEAAA